MKIGMILDEYFPPDDRPEKEALSLIEQGYSVSLLCPAQSSEKLEEDYKGIIITRFKLNRFIRRKFRPLYLLLPFYKWIWKNKIRRFIKKNKLDVIHIHDLPLTDIVYSLTKGTSIKIVCDQHEYYSNWIANTAHYNTKIGKVVNKFSNWVKYEKENLQKADLVITVEEPLRQEYIRNIGIPSNRIITVPNTPTYKFFKNFSPNMELKNKYKNYFILFYAGTIDSLRGIDMIIRALPKLEKTIPNIKFIIAGRAFKNFSVFDFAKSIKASGLIDFIGWIPIEALPSYIELSQICLFTPKADRVEINNTIATKIYQYLALHKPIIVSQARMMKNFVEKNGLGVSVKYGDIEGFTEAVIGIYRDYNNYSKQVKKNSEQLFKAKSIFWEQTVKNMLNYYKRFEIDVN